MFSIEEKMALDVRLDANLSQRSRAGPEGACEA